MGTTEKINGAHHDLSSNSAMAKNQKKMFSDESHPLFQLLSPKNQYTDAHIGTGNRETEEASCVIQIGPLCC